MTPQQLFVPRVLFASIVFSNAMLAYVAVFVLGAKTSVDWSAVASSSLSPQETLYLGLGLAAAVLSVVVPLVLVRVRRPEGAPLQRAFPPFVMGLALAEACTLFGLVSFQVGAAPPERTLLHAAAAIFVLLAFHLPTTTRMQKLGNVEPS